MKNLNKLKQNLIAHRGVHDENIPENSMLAFKEALKYKYIIELDVHLLKDNQIVVFHDKNLNRMCNTNKIIEKLNYDEIKKFNLKNTNEKIPKLIDVLKLIDGKVPVIIELKTEKINFKLEKELIKLLDNYNGYFVVKSFNPFSIYWFKKNKPDYIRGLLINNKYNNIIEFLNTKLFFLKICKPDLISCKKEMYNNKKIIKYKKNNIVLAWTINSKNSYNKYKNKFDNLICNNIKEVK